jgi:hypothetical protein
VPGCEVTLSFDLYGADEAPAPVVRTADAEGRVAFDVPELPAPAASFVAEARAPGWAPARSTVLPGVEAELRLWRSVPVEGRVVDETGAPVAGARIAMGEWEVASEPDGRFLLHAHDEGPARILVRHPSYVEAHAGVTAPARDLRFVLKRGLSISGRVVFPSGAPVPGITIVCDRGFPWRETETAEDGGFVVSGLPPGLVTLYCPAFAKTDVAAGSAGVELVARRHVVRIRALDDRGRPFRRATFVFRLLPDTVPAEQTGGTVGEDGLLVTCQPGETTLLFSPGVPGFECPVLSLDLHGPLRLHDVAVTLRRVEAWGALDLRVRDEAGGRPARVSLQLTNAAGTGPFREWVEVDEEGRAVVERVPPGRYRATVTVPNPGPDDFRLPAEAEVEVRGGARADLAVVLPLGGRIRVTVLGAEGTSRAPADVCLEDPDGKERGTLWSKVASSGVDAGAALSRPLPPGRYGVRLRRGAGAGEEVWIVAGAVADVRLVAPK